MRTLQLGIELFSLVVMLILGSLGYVKPAFAESPADFYKGKTFVATVNSSPGGGYDTWMRLMAPYLKKYTGVDKVVVRNMPGAGGVVGWNYLYNVAKPDGLTTGMESGMSLVLNELLDEPTVKYKFAKFEWLGRITTESSTIAVGKNSPYKSIGNIRKAPLFKFGSMSRTVMFGVMPVVTGLVLGANNFKVVLGYKGGAELQLATLRGEVDALCSSYPSIKHLVDSGDLVLIAILNYNRLKDVPDVPTIFELVPDIPAEAKKWIDLIIKANDLHRVVLTSPGVPKDRVDFLTEAIKKTLHDQEFVSKGKKMEMYVEYQSPAEVRKQLKNLTLAPEEKKYLKYLLFDKY